MSSCRVCTCGCHFVISHKEKPGDLVWFCPSDTAEAVLGDLANGLLLFSETLMIHALPISRNVPHQWGFAYGDLVKPLVPGEF